MKHAVLIIEDNPTFREVLIRFLHKQVTPSQIETARDAAEAMRSLDTFHPDVVLLDVFLPGTSGLRLIPLLRERLPENTVIVTISSMNSPPYRSAALAAGSDAFVGKDEIAETLVGTIEQALQRRNPSATGSS